MHHAVNPDPYRGAFGSDADKYVRDVQEIIEFGTTGHVAGFISEAIQVHSNTTDRVLTHRQQLFCSSRCDWTTYVVMTLWNGILLYCTGCGWNRGGVTGVPAAGVRQGPEGRRALHRRRGPGGIRPRRQPLLGVRDPRRGPRHRDHGKGTYTSF